MPISRRAALVLPHFSPRRRARPLKAAVLLASLLLSISRTFAGPGDIATVAGTGAAGSGGDGGPATAGQLRTPRDVALGPDGSLFIADHGNHRVRKVAPDGTLSTVAGTGVGGYNGDGIPATSARLQFPAGVVVDPDGHLLIADKHNDRIRRVDATTGLISTIGGNGFSGSAGDGGPATAARINNPAGLALGPDGSLFIADEGNNKIRKIDPLGIISTVAGTGVVGFQGDFGPAISARLDNPSGVAVATDGTLFIADKGNNRIRRVDSAGIITTLAGSTGGYAGDGGPADAARLAQPFDIALSPLGSLYIADADNHRIRKIDSQGTISTLGGIGTAGYSGDGGPAILAALRHPISVADDPSGRVFLADENNHRVRRIDDTCGNGQLDEGEPCDLDLGGNGAPNTCCLPGCQLRPAGELCRPAVDECDIDDFCDGSGGECPVDTVHPDGDTDGVCDPIDVCPLDFDPDQEDRDLDGPGDACDPCTNLFGTAVGRARVLVTRLQRPAGAQKLVVAGKLLPFPPQPIIDPLRDGLRLLVEDASGLRLDATLPADAYDFDLRAGWKRRDNAQGFVAVYSDAGTRRPLIGGIQRVKLAVDTAGGIKSFKLVAKDLALPLGEGDDPLRVTIVFDPPHARDGHCGEMLFEAPPPTLPSCLFLRKGATLLCR